MISNEDWIINLENAAKRANELKGYDVATGVFQRYEAYDPYTLSSCYYDAAFCDLESIANDL